MMASSKHIHGSVWCLIFSNQKVRVAWMISNLARDQQFYLKEAMAFLPESL
jgi:hypothetical protein